VKRVEFSADRCKGCGLCIKACPRGIIKFSDVTNEKGYRVATVEDQDKCTSCGLCAVMCPDVAIRVKRPVRKAV